MALFSAHRAAGDDSADPVPKPRTPVNVTVADPARHKRRVNEQISRNVEGLRPQSTPFLCECLSPACLRTVWLTPDEYAAATATADGVLAPDHQAAAVPAR